MKCNLIFRRFLCHFEYWCFRIEAEPKHIHTLKKEAIFSIYTHCITFNAFARTVTFSWMIELRVITMYWRHFIPPERTFLYSSSVGSNFVLSVFKLHIFHYFCRSEISFEANRSKLVERYAVNDEKEENDSLTKW